MYIRKAHLLVFNIQDTFPKKDSKFYGNSKSKNKQIHLLDFLKKYIFDIPLILSKD